MITLTDITAVKRYMNLPGTNSDSVLTGLVATQSQAFLDETGRGSFDSQNYNEVRDGMGSDIMQLSFFPVTAVASVQIDSNVLSLSTAWNSVGYQFDSLGKISLIGFKFCRGRKNVLVQYTAGYQNVAITGEVQTIPSAAPFVIQVAQPNWRVDSGVSYFGGGALTPTTGPPSAGQYLILGAGGYQFAAADAGKQVAISYQAAGYPADIVGAVNEMVLLRYRQRDQMDVKSMSIGGTVTTYSKDDYPKDVWRVIKKYKKYTFVAGF